MATVVRSPIRLIVRAIQAQLVEITGLDISCVNFVARSVALKTMAEQIIWIKPAGFSNQEPIDTGAGRVDARVTRILEIMPWVRLALDPGAVFDESWLLSQAGVDAAMGYFELEDMVLDALYDFLPEDTDGNALLTQPMKFIGGGAPEKQDPATYWGDAILRFSVDYELSLDQSRQ